MPLYNVKQGQPHNQPVQVASANGAILLLDGGHVPITKGSVCALTLAVPVRNGVELTIYATTAHAHTVTVSGGIAGAGAAADVGTFGGAVGDGVTLISFNNLWYVKPGTNLNVTFA